MNASSKLVGVLIAGWLAQALASTDPDIDAGVEAYEAEDYEAALTRFDAARDRLGERPEIAFDRGLAMLRLDKLDEARSAFERASEAEDDILRASAHYELGNLEFDAEAYDAAIGRYIDALKANPLHDNAKWNLELALQKKKEQEEQEEEQEENEEDQENEEAEENEDEQEEGEENEDEQEEGEENEQQEDEQEEGEQDEGEQDEQEEGEQDEQEEGEQEQQEEGEQEQQEEGEQEQPEQQEEPEPEPAEPKPVDRMDMKRALEQLDEQDPFTLDRAQGGYVQPEKDW